MIVHTGVEAAKITVLPISGQNVNTEQVGKSEMTRYRMGPSLM